MMKTILVTGGAGFLGRFTSLELSRSGHRVIAIGHGNWLPHEYQAFGISLWHPCDITIESISTYGAEVDEIYHCAGSGSVTQSFADPIGDFRSNVVTTLNVLEFARVNRHVKIVILSSAGVYGRVTEMPIRIDGPINPLSPYGTNKAICEQLTSQYSSCFGIQAVIVRLFSVYGETLRKQLLWDAANKLINGDYNFFGTGNETRDWLHVHDAARLLVTASTVASSKTPILNGGCGVATRVREIVEMLALSLGVDHPICFTNETRAGDPMHYQADIAEAKAIGWSPRITLINGLARYADWFQGCINNR